VQTEGRGRARKAVTEGWRLGRATLARAARDRITTNAASLAFHWVLAIFPVIVAAVGVLGLVGLSAAQRRSLVHGVGVLLPVQASQAIDLALRNPLTGAGGGLEVTVALLVALWSGIEAMAALEVGLDVAYEITSDRGFVRRRLVAVPLLGLTVVLGGAASGLLVLGDPIRSLLPSSLAIARPTFDATWTVLRLVGALALVMLLLSAYYAIGPNQRRVGLRVASPGAVAAAVGWLGTSAAFSYYLNHFGHEARSYGAFAGVAALLLWLFLTGVAVLLGAELDRELARRRHARPGSTPPVATDTSAGGLPAPAPPAAH
jgi:membrane protein